MADIELVIKIPRKIYKAICDKNALGCDIGDIKNIIRNGTPLPKGATNGDMIKAMFPNIEIEGIGGITGLECVAVSIGLGTSYFALDWWDAPYKAESEDKYADSN